MKRLTKISTTAICILAATLLGSPIKADESLAAETCEASWYGPGLHGNDMANGERFNMNDPTVVAHKEFPFGTILRITNLNNGESVVVEVQDRGPFKPGRCVDLSRAAAQEIGLTLSGVAPVRVEVLS